MLVHNQLTMNSGFDFELLDVELDNIDIDMKQFGFDVSLDEEEPAEIIEDEILRMSIQGVNLVIFGN